MKRFLFSSLTFVLASLASHAASITVSAPPSVSGSFDVAVNAADVFANFPDPADGLLAFGFSVDVGSPLFTFTGATVNPVYFDPGCCADPDVVGGVKSSFGFVLQSGDFTEPLLLATLHFSINGSGSTTVGISADNSADLNQGLIFLLGGVENFSDSESVTASAVTPEPGTMLISGLSLAGLYAFRRRFSSR